MKVIQAIDIHKTYNPDKVPVKALNGISMEIDQGEFAAIVGPSGSGKTTLLNIIGGLDEPTAGKIILNGKEISSFTDNQMINFRLNNIGFVFQSYNLIPVLSAFENIEFVMLLQKIPEKTRRERTLELLEAVDLVDKKDKRPTELSGGQQQRVAVARALASKPAFILADEPTANLDSASTSNLLDIMLKLNQRENTTFVFSTHDQRVIDKARRIITIDDGKIKDDVLNELAS
jgi:putative ABC transport system ATP-binding protein